MECVDRVKPQLDKLEQDKTIERWHLNLNHSECLLEMETNKLSSEEAKHLIRETDFDAEFTKPPQAR